MVGENTSRFLPPAASSPTRTASWGPQFRNVTPSAGFASSGWCVSTKIGPSQAPPYGRLSPTAASQPARPPSTAPVVSTYSSARPGRNEMPVIQPISWLGAATNPSSDIVKCQSTFPPAVCGRVSVIRRLPSLGRRDDAAAQLLDGLRGTLDRHGARLGALPVPQPAQHGRRRAGHGHVGRVVAGTILDGEQPWAGPHSPRCALGPHHV